MQQIPIRTSVLIVCLILFSNSVLGLKGSGATSTSTAGFVLDPAISYSVGVIKQSGISDIGTQSVNFEARLGYSFSGYELGVSYGLGSGTSEQAGSKGDFKPVDLAVYASAGMPFSLAVTGAYIMNAKTKINAQNNPYEFSGSGFRYGIGYTGLPYVNLMLEKVQRSYTKYNGSSLSNKLDDSTMVLSLSVPLLN